jgi:hypothetical protein
MEEELEIVSATKYEIGEVYSVAAGATPGTYILDLDLSINGIIDRCMYGSVPNDMHGAAPMVRQWLTDNPEFPIQPYVAPTAEEIRTMMPNLTARQLRLGLVRNGIPLSSVEAAIAALPDESERAEAEIEWQFASSYSRMHPLINAVGANLGLAPEQMDIMWLTATTI